MLEKLSGIPANVRDALTELVEKVGERYDDAEVYLFGSYAKNSWLEDSDVDTIIISRKFKGKNMPERVAEIRKLAPKNIAFEILAYTPNEFKKALEKSIVCKEALTHWKKLI